MSDESPISPTSNNESGESAEEEQIMILVVDDDAQILNFLTIALKDSGYRVVTCEDGAAAYDHLKSEDCRCMLLDINMPRISGIELLMLMQNDGIQVPTIIMAGFSDFDEGELQGFSNVKKLIQKPFAMKELLAAIGEHARKS